MIVSGGGLLAGYDSGLLALFALGTGAKLAELRAHNDYISSLSHLDDKTVVSTSGDGTLAVWDTRKFGGGDVKGVPASLIKQSDELEDELLSCAIVKHGTKIVCGTQGGILNIWTKGTYGDFGDRFPGHPESIECVVKVDEVSQASEGERRRARRKLFARTPSIDQHPSTLLHSPPCFSPHPYHSLGHCYHREQ